MVAVQASTVARVTGIEFPYKDLRGGATTFLPQRIAVIGQGATASTYDTTKLQVTSALEVGQTYGFGSPLHLAVLQLLPTNGDGVGVIPVTVYPLEDDASGAASTGTITPAGEPTVAAEYVVRINNIDSAAFVISVGDVVADVTAAMTAAINANVNMPVTAADGTTVVNLTSKWEGTSANDIFVEVVGSTTAGNTFTIVQPTGGLVNPDISTAIDQIGDVWESLILNCFESTDTDILDDLETWGEGRWQPLVAKMAIAFSGTNESSVTTAIAVPDARKTDRVNCQLVSPGSNDLPCVIAARQLARIAVVANDNPARDYGSQKATGLTPGLDSAQWTHTQRDQAVKGGSSTITVKDGIVNLSDIVTYYHPSGDPLPPYRFVAQIVRLQQKSFNLKLIFETEEWDGAPLVPDDQAVINPAARKPKDAVAAIASMLDGLAAQSIISGLERAKTTITATISPTNGDRLDISLTDQNSGNTRIKSITNNWGFYFGTPTAV